MAEHRYGPGTRWEEWNWNVTVDVELNDKERRASDAIVEAMYAIQELAEDGSAVYNFTNEAVPAIHKLQMFVVMHWAHRIHPDEWSNWFDMELTPKKINDLLDNLTAK